MREAISLFCPPFSQDEIIMLKGKPTSKEVRMNKGPLDTIEKWEYIPVNDNCKESYFFRNNRLVGWRKNNI